MSASEPTAGAMPHGATIDFVGDVNHVADEYRALTSGCGLVPLGARTQIELRGDDRAVFLHNLTSNDIRGLPAGRGCEAFLLNAQGKVLFFVTLFAGEESHVLETIAGCNEHLLAHLDRYLIREKVELIDHTPERRELLLAGPKSIDVLRAATGQEPPQAWLSHRTLPMGAVDVEVRRTDWTGPVEFLLSCAAEWENEVRSMLLAHGATLAGGQAFQQARVERGTPWPEIDIHETTLPQELGRETRTLSFTKGCYIGQETVARIDALGHVNRKFVGLRFATDAHPDVMSDALSSAGKSVGGLTSVAYSPRLGAPLALGYIRAPLATPGTKVDSPWGSAEVVKLPVQ